MMLTTAGTARAAGSSMPWEAPLTSILESIQGPVARIVAVIIIISTGLALAFGDTSGGFRKLIQQLAHRGIACVLGRLAVVALRLEFHVLGELAHLL